MRCVDIRKRIHDGWIEEVAVEAREHLASCPSCTGYLRNARLLHAGFSALAEEPAPEATLGFAVRLVRRLGEAAEERAREEFFERVGRRFVFATLVLALMLVLAIALPPSGPLRGPASAESVLAAPELTIDRTDPIFGDEVTDNSSVLPGNVAPVAKEGKR